MAEVIPPSALDEHMRMVLCPECGNDELVHGYGLACGPGFGPYVLCPECPWEFKVDEFELEAEDPHK